MDGFKENGDKLDELIGNSLQTKEEPDAELNILLKARLYQAENVMRQNKGQRQISLWYIPMLLNGIMFLAIAVMCRVFISDIVILSIVTTVCTYLTIAGIVLTVAGIKYSDFKTLCFVIIRKKEILN